MGVEHAINAIIFMVVKYYVCNHVECMMVRCKVTGGGFYLFILSKCPAVYSP